MHLPSSQVAVMVQYIVKSLMNFIWEAPKSSITNVISGQTDYNLLFCLWLIVFNNGKQSVLVEHYNVNEVLNWTIWIYNDLSFLKFGHI